MKILSGKLGNSGSKIRESYHKTRKSWSVRK